MRSLRAALWYVFTIAGTIVGPSCVICGVLLLMRGLEQANAASGQAGTCSFFYFNASGCVLEPKNCLENSADFESYHRNCSGIVSPSWCANLSNSVTSGETEKMLPCGSQYSFKLPDTAFFEERDANCTAQGLAAQWGSARTYADCIADAEAKTKRKYKCLFTGGAKCIVQESNIIGNFQPTTMLLIFSGPFLILAGLLMFIGSCLYVEQCCCSRIPLDPEDTDIFGNFTNVDDNSTYRRISLHPSTAETGHQAIDMATYDSKLKL
jgi:hypothetical protein